MAVNRRSRNNVAYGLDNPLQGLAPQPIVAQRDPSVNDTGVLGSLWVNNATDAYFVLTSVAGGGSTWTPQSTGSSTVASLTVTGGAGTVLTVDAGGNTDLGGDLAIAGDTVMTGGLIVNGDLVANGDFDITDASAISLTSTANVDPSILLHANGGVLEVIELHADQGTALNSIYLLSDVGGIKLDASKADVAAINLVAGAGGVKIDAALTSAFNVTGAGQDIQLNATGGSVAITATEATSGAVTISASDAAGSILLSGVGGLTAQTTNATMSLQSGTGALNIATGAAANITTIGNGTGASQVVVAAGTAGINMGSNAVAHPVNIGNNTGATAVAINGGTAAGGSISIGATANDVPVTIGSSTGASNITINGGTAGVGIGANAIAHPITIGNVTGATSVTIGGGTGGAGFIDIGSSANAVPIIIGNVTGNTSVAIDSGTGGIAMVSTGAGDITIASSDTVLIDSAGVLELNSSAGVIGIGNDAVAQNINIGTGAAARVITIGNATSTTAVSVNCGTGGANFGTSATAHATTIGSTTAAATLALQTPTGTNVLAANGLSVTTAGRGLSLPGGLLVITGAGAPSGVVTAPVGSLYLNTTGATTITRLYINVDAGTTWANFTASA